MPLNAVELNTIDELYAFVEMAIHKTALVLDDSAIFRPWARTVSAECQDVQWAYPSRPLSEHLLQHLAIFAHRPLPDKGFLLFETGQMVGLIDVDAVGGSSRPDYLAPLVHQVFISRGKSSTGTGRVATQHDFSDPYSVLGANEMDSEEEIKKKHKQMVMQYHPDRVAHLGPELKELAAKKTTEINGAFAAIRRIRGF